MSDLNFAVNLTADGRQLVSEVNKSSESFDRLSASARGASGDAAKLNAANNQLGASLNSVRMTTAEVSAAVAIQNAASEAQQKYFDAQRDKAWALANGYKEVEGQLIKMAGATAVDAAANDAHAVSVKTNSTAIRESLVLMREASRGNFTRMAGSASILANALGFLPMLLNPIGLAIGAVAAVGIGMAYAFERDRTEIEAMNNALAITNNFAGITQSGMESLAQSMSQSGQMTVGTSKDIVTALVASGQIGAQAIGEVAGLAANYARATGEDVDKIAPKMVKLFSDPLKGAEELNKQMHFLTAADLDYIDSLERAGEAQKAQLFLAEKLNSNLDQQTVHVNVVAKAWRDFANDFNKITDAAFGKPHETKINSSKDEIDAQAAKNKGQADELWVREQLKKTDSYKVGQLQADMDRLNAQKQTVQVLERERELGDQINQINDKKTKAQRDAAALNKAHAKEAADAEARLNILNAETGSGSKLTEGQKKTIELAAQRDHGVIAPKEYSTRVNNLAPVVAAEVEAQAVAKKTAEIKKLTDGYSNNADSLQKKNDADALNNSMIGKTLEQQTALRAQSIDNEITVLTQTKNALDSAQAYDGERIALDKLIAAKNVEKGNVIAGEDAKARQEAQKAYDGGFKSTLNKAFEPNANMLDVAGKNFGAALKKSIKETFTSSIFDSTLKGFSDHLAGSMTAVLGQMGGGKKALPTDWVSASLAVAAAASIAFAPQASAMQLNLANASYVQQFQGTGSVTGEAMTQSHSISDSLKLLSSTATTGNTYTQQMLMHLKSVDLSMSSFVTAAAKSIGVDIASTMGVARESSTNSANGLLGGYMTNGPLGAAMGNSPFMQSVIGAVLGKSNQSVTDSGLSFSGTLGSLAQGKGVSTYVSGTNTSTGLFGTGIGGSSSTFTSTSAAPSDIATSFASIYTGIAASFKSAGKAMGMDVSTVDTTFKNFKTTLTTLSFEGLNATQKYAALDAAISKDADLLARQLFPSMVQFNIAGEGMDKTVIRVIAENASVVTELNAMGSASVKAGASTYQLTNSLVLAAGNIDTLMTSMQNFNKSYTTGAAQSNALYASAKNQFSGTPLDGLINSKTTATQIAAYVNAAMTSGIDSNTKVQILNAANSFSQFLTSVQAGIDQLKASYDAVISSRDAVVASIKNLQLFNVTMQDFRRQVVVDNTMANPVAKYTDAKKYFDDIAAKAAAGDSIAQSKLQSASQQLLSTSMTASGSYTQYQRDYNSVLAAVDNTMSYNDTMIKSGQDMLSALDTQNNISTAIQANTFDTRIQTIELSKNLNGYAVASAQFALQTSVASDAAKTALTDYISKNDANMKTLIGGVTTSVGGVTSAISTVKDILANQPALLQGIVTADQAAITAATAAALDAIAKTTIPAIKIAVTQAATAATSSGSSSGQSGGGIGNQVASAVNHAGDVVAQVFGWSDPRLKENIKQVGKTNYGLNLYDFNYLGESQRYRGVMSTEVRRVMPSAVITQNGFDSVNYGMLGLKMTKVGGSFEVGSNYIPHDMVAQIHSGEEITPRPYVDLQKAARDETNSLLSRLVSAQIEMRNDLARLTDNQKRDNASIRDSAQRTADLLDMISANGGPLEVKVVTA